MKTTMTANGTVTHPVTGAVPFEGLVRPTLGIGETVAELVFAAIRGVKRAIAALVYRRQVAVTARALRELSDAQLYDVGVHRGEIYAAARAAVDAGRARDRGLRA